MERACILREVLVGSSTAYDEKSLDDLIDLACAEIRRLRIIAMDQPCERNKMEPESHKVTLDATAYAYYYRLWIEVGIHYGRHRNPEGCSMCHVYVSEENLGAIDGTPLPGPFKRYCWPPFIHEVK